MNKYTHELIVGIFVVFGLACLGYMTVKFGDVSLLGDNSYKLYAEFRSVAGLRTGNGVDMLGMRIGQVAGFRMDQDRQVAVVEMKLQKGINVFGDAVASIKTEGLIGERYVSIDPGGAADVLKPGETILDTESPLDIGDLIGRFAFGEVKKESLGPEE